MVNRRHFSVALGQGAAAVAAGFAGVASAQSEAPLVLGQSAPLTRPAAQLGLQFNEGARLWLDAYGQAGLAGVTLALAQHKLQPSSTATVERNSEDVSAAVARLVLLRPDAIVQVGAYHVGSKFVELSMLMRDGGRGMGASGPDDRQGGRW